MPETEGTRVRRSRQMAHLIEQYNKAHHKEPEDSTEPHLVAAWAIEQGLWDKPPPDPEELLRRQLSRHLRNEHITDPQGREVRKYHAIIVDEQSATGLRRRSRWHEIFKAPPKHMQMSLQIRRRAAFDDVKQLSFDFESYNDNNVFNATLKPMDFNYNIDLEELRHPTTYPDEPPDDATDDDGETI